MTTLNLTLTVTLINLTAAKGHTKIPDWAKVILNSKLVSYVSFGEKLPPAVRNSAKLIYSCKFWCCFAK